MDQSACHPLAAPEHQETKFPEAGVLLVVLVLTVGSCHLYIEYDGMTPVLCYIPNKLYSPLSRR